MYSRTSIEAEVIARFHEFWQTKHEGPVSVPEVNAIVGQVSGQFSERKYVLGLAIDFVVLADQVERLDSRSIPLSSSQDVSDLFRSYPLVETRGGRKSNTLTVTAGGRQVGIRKIEESVVQAFHEMLRSDFPSAYVYNTGQWSKYRGLLVSCFQLDAASRSYAIDQLFDYGLSQLSENVFHFAPNARPRVFESILSDYQRSDAQENGGLVLQALAYGWVATCHRLLDIEADKVRAGSKRQRRFGDIDGYRGLELQLSVEVKDLHIDMDNFARELGAFSHAASAHGFHAIVLANSFSEEAGQKLREAGVHALPLSELERTVSLWDWAKQDSALYSTLHYIAHIEQNPQAVVRLQDFVRAKDPNHETLRVRG